MNASFFISLHEEKFLVLLTSGSGGHFHSEMTFCFVNNLAKLGGGVGDQVKDSEPRARKN